MWHWQLFLKRCFKMTWFTENWAFVLNGQWVIPAGKLSCPVCMWQMKFSSSQLEALCQSSSPVFWRVQSCANDNRNLAFKSKRSFICFARLAVVTHHVSLQSRFGILLVCDWTLHNKIFSSLAEQEVSCRLKWLEPNLGNVLVVPAIHLVFVIEAVVLSPSFLALSPWKTLTLRQVSLTAYIVYTRTRITRLAFLLSWYCVNGG